MQKSKKVCELRKFEGSSERISSVDRQWPGRIKSFRAPLNQVFGPLLLFLALLIFSLLSWSSAHWFLWSLSAIIALAGCALFARPLLLSPVVVVSTDGYIAVHYGNGDEYRGLIHESLAAVTVEKSGRVRSFRFVFDGAEVQISPETHGDGYEMVELFFEMMERHQIDLDIIDL